MKRTFLTVLAGVSVLGLAACGSGSPSGETGTEGASPEAGAGGLEKVTVGVIPIVDTAPLYLGEEKGFFEEEGLDLDIQTVAGGAAAIPAVVSGGFDFSFGNVVSVMVANDKGLDIQLVANGNSTSGDVSKDFSGVVVPEDSDIQSAKDLAGKTVSVNTLANIGDTTIRSIVEEDGGDPESVKFVEVGFPDAPAALANGQVDAAWILDPFLSKAVADGGRVISYNFADFDPNLDISGYFTTGDTVENKPELVAKFKAAMNKSLEYAQENPEEVRDIVGTYTKIEEADRAEMALPTFRKDFNMEAAQKLADAAVKYGTLSKAPDLESMYP
ncbi:ABC-type nitrate/sulfonate/bicarbonate transport systems periplasmic components-like protein [Arthrobacter crystallopoietes BAB-32]|uniref:ABC-type nitrate/sulfonate/bicarbonate transport systems periplasmic components-like protein n=1 Tax=Arthrobacter crystallopoietes BAB-32 TaxID=1246476 RepID=N1V1W7_9MICC|nr:ABC transporter substrate-binding protein [Arthrobacter crystallopoietes]EMY32233.1 ABC-type nitrate/sulfonate/bicarbonate transport systems periplasmic components-like protein [Arthrobacter crystallopoietes BAB-32]